MGQEQIGEYVLSQRISEGFTAHDHNLRANVESTVHQVFHRLGKNQKIKYRGLAKCHWYVLSRAISVNFRRIHKYLAQKTVYPLFLALGHLVKVLGPKWPLPFSVYVIPLPVRKRF